MSSHEFANRCIDSPFNKGGKGDFFGTATTSRLPGFYNLSPAERRKLLAIQFEYSPNQLTFEQADKMTENAVGTFSLPLGVAPNFVVDGQPVIVPMVTEEPSVVAAASHMAKIIAQSGGFRTEVDEPVMIGQIQLLDVPDFDRAKQAIEENVAQLIDAANQYCPKMVQRGGGCREVVFRPLASGICVVHVLIDCQDAMGANVVNTVMEGLAPHLVNLTGGRAGIKILSNLADQRLARASCEISYDVLPKEVAHRMAQACAFAQLDPYRAATHNKGVMNGIDAVAIATGNDFRAIEAGAHAYAARSGHYASLSHFEADDEACVLKCSLQLPLAVGIVGGCAAIHPTVLANLKLLGHFGKSAKKLAALMAAVGLAQNLAAVRALACEGIQAGHMKLHQRRCQ